MRLVLRWMVLVVLLAHRVAAAQVEYVKSATPADPTPEALTQRNQTPLTYKITFEPAHEPFPPLKYRLTPDYWELQPGNAAPFYYRALLLQAQLPADVTQKYADNEERWLNNLSDPAVRKEVQEWVGHYRTIVGQLQTAAYREEVDFSFNVRELSGQETIGFLLPEIQEMRSLARMLQLKARLEIEEGRLEEAIETVRMGYQMARAASQPPFLVAGLVGVAIESIMNDVLLHLIAAPGAPNLYWAIADLPQPLADLRPSIHQEMGLPQQLFPLLKDAETAERTTEEWRTLLIEAMRALASLGNGDQGHAELMAAALAIKAYPEAKRELIAAGYDPQRVAAMPVGQVIAIQTGRITDYAYQEAFKWWSLPYWQVARQMEAVDEALIQEGVIGPAARLSRGALPVASLLLPATWNARLAQVRFERNRAAMQTLEAIRMHAAQSGSLPESLDELSPPAPRNPSTGQPFSYQRIAAGAVLEAPAIGDQPPRVTALRYEITLRK